MELTVDNITTEKPLQDLLSQFKELLKPLQYELETKVYEAGGSVQTVEFVVRIQYGGRYGRTR